MAKRTPATRTKERVSRISLDYYKHHDRMLIGKRWLAGCAVLLAVGWTAASMIAHDQTPYSPGPLSWSHAAWEKQCSACHVDFVAVRSDAILANSSAVHTMGRQCQHCHSGTDHHSNTKPAEIACASCHIEHQGRGNLVTRVADTSCTNCHADLKNHTNGATQFDNVTGFDKLHPLFRSSKSPDTGKLKFSHLKHLLPGLSLRGANQPEAWTLDQIPQAFRQQYARFVPQDDPLHHALTLDCSACHQLGTAAVGSKSGSQQRQVLSPDSAGAYMLPIKYESHCQACHPLNFRPPNENKSLFEPRSPELIAHGLQGRQVDLFLEQVFSAQVLAEDPSLMDKVFHNTPLPDKPAAPDHSTFARTRQKAVSSSSHFLQLKCENCHEPAAKTVPHTFPDVGPVNVRQVWFEHARFDHAPHRAVACRDCHNDESLSGILPEWIKTLSHAQKETDRSTLDHQKVLIPNIEKCRECHGPAVKQQDQLRVGARFDCVECHVYHGHDDQTHTKYDSADFLSGGAHEKP